MRLQKLIRATSFAAFALASVALIDCSNAKADAIFNYTSAGVPFGSGDYITATVDVTCTVCDNATFNFPADITFFSLSAFSSSNALLATISSNDANTTMFSLTDFITLSSGQVTAWLLDIGGTANFLGIGTATGFTDANTFQTADGQFTENNDLFGTWSVSAVGVPGPVVGAGLPGLLAGFGAMLAWYRKRRAVAI